MTERIYYNDSYQTEFRAHVLESLEDGRRLYLDRTAFYPASGGQPHDTGCIDNAMVTDVIEEEDGRIAHVLSTPVEHSDVNCRIDWVRRFDHMQQHSGQHLLSAVLMELFSVETLSFHLGDAASTIDLSVASLEPEQLRAAEARANVIVFENRPLAVEFRDASENLELRKPCERQGKLRIVNIEGLDRSACGGTHVRSTGEVGAVLIRRLEKMRGNLRIEFLCGMRAVRRARLDYEALAEISRSLSASLDETPTLIAVQLRRLNESEKARHKLSIELARMEGAALHDATEPGPDGVRRVSRTIAQGPIDDNLRALAQGFTSRNKAVFAAFVEEPPSLLVAVSAATGLHAGNLLKSLLAGAGGRGGGNAQLAQGSVSSREALERIRGELNG